MKRKNTIIYFILLISLLVNSYAFAETNEEIFLFNVELLLNDHTREIFPIYKSPFLNDETQIKETLEYLLKRNDVKEVLKVNDRPIEESEYSDYVFSIDIANKDIDITNEKYKKTNDLPMTQRDSDNKVINTSTKTTVDVKVDGATVTKDKKGYLENGRALVPFRVIAEALGINIGYLFKENLKLVWGIRYDIKVDMKIGDFRAYKNGKLLYMDSYPVIKDGITYIPIRYFAELFNYEIQWDQQENEVNILTRGVRDDEK